MIARRERPLRHLDPLRSHHRVIRLVRLPKDFDKDRKLSGVSLQSGFELSTQDRQATPPHLSCYADHITTATQALDLLLERSPHTRKDGATVLSVDAVRGIEVPQEKLRDVLDVLWVHVEREGEQAASALDKVVTLLRRLRREMGRLRPSDGHAGITGTDYDDLPARQANRSVRKYLRHRLAELASETAFRLRSVPSA